MKVVALANPVARTRVLMTALMAVIVAIALPGGVAPPPMARAAAAPIEHALLGIEGSASVIVRALPGRLVDAERAIAAQGGTIATALPIIEGFEATIPAAALAEVASSPAVHSISANHAIQFEEFSYDAATTASTFAKTSGATTAWSQDLLGNGVGVAVIDTGVSEMNDLKGRIVHGPDLSGEGTLVDNYGHGTVMAGIIAGGGNDSASRASGAYTGVAPKAHVVSVKAAGRDGSADVTTMLQAMHFVSAYKDQLNIRVLNLSWGTKSTQDPAVDPLNYAVERLWRQGIVVVVAAGNSGPNAGTVTKPGDDPVVLTVGAFNDNQNLDPRDDSIPGWSSRGPSFGRNKPDVVAPGRTLIASRSYGSYVEQNNPKALVSPSYIRGSGTSQAAAVTSGAVALLLQARPELTPDQVKAIITGSASRIAGAGTEQGAGRLNTGAALAAPAGAASWQTFAGSGLGSIEASRGGRNVETDCNRDGVNEVIQGEIDVRCEAWNGTTWTGTTWTGDAWTGTTWTGTTWTGTTWTGTNWTGTTWTGTTWTGGQWTGTTWTGTTWTGTTWTGSAWTGTTWTGTTWTGTTWTGTTWTGSEYTTGEYDAEFLSAFWGGRPKAGVRLPGEVAEDQMPRLPFGLLS